MIPLSKVSLETLIDLVEIRLGCVEIYDREDARELTVLEQCRNELVAIRDGIEPRKATSYPAANGRQSPPMRLARH